MNAVKDDVIALVEKELISANKKFPLFRSSHEGYAVIKEELDECFDELVNAKGSMAMMWKDIKLNNQGINSAMNLRFTAVNMAIEAIQVAAMAQKYINSMEAKNEN